MPRVLRIINRFNLGGPTYNAAYLTRYMQPEFETMLIGGSPLPDEAHSGFILDELGIPYTELPEMGRGIDPMADLKAFRKIRKIIREFRPDIVHTHAAKAGAVGRMAAYMENVPVIVHTFHGHVFSGYFSPWKSSLVKGVERWLARKTSAIVTISEKQKNEIVDEHHICDPEKAHIIPLGFDLDRFSIHKEEKRKKFREQYFLNDDEVAIGIIGRFAPVKNHQLFFDALKELYAHNSNFKAFIIGDGDAKKQWTEYVSELGVSEIADKNAHVLFTSWIKKIDEVLPGLDMVVLSSLNEGTPVSLIEAQASGTAVISTDVGGARDCVLNEQTGLIVPPSDIQGLSAAMLRLMNKDLRKKMGDAGPAFVRHKYSYTRLVKEMQELYNKALSDKRIGK